MHQDGGILVLPNAWDAATARVFAQVPNCRALATTSAGVAFALGYPDGEAIPPSEMLAAVARIARAVRLPLTADLEAGYGDAPEDAAATAEGAIEAGAVGLNLEDGATDAAAALVDVEAHVAKIQAVRTAGEQLGVPLVINARVDVYIRSVGEEAARLEHAVARANAYLRAGADCAFVPAVADAALIGRLADAIEGPLNILAGAETPPVAELHRLGVARVSVGSAPMRAALALTERLGRELLEQGTFTGLADALSYDEANRLLETG
jgi:2-methylisocitrate lyase-like PEP mutase family enzyme